MQSCSRCISSDISQRLFVGASGRPPGHSTILESLIPNSQVIINPPFFHLPDQIEESPPVKARSKHWRSELFLHPGDWVPWVGAAVVGMVLVLGMVVVGLNGSSTPGCEGCCPALADVNLTPW